MISAASESGASIAKIQSIDSMSYHRPRFDEGLIEEVRLNN